MPVLLQMILPSLYYYRPRPPVIRTVPQALYPDYLLPFRLLVWRGKLDFPVDPTGPDECRVQSVDAVSGHNHLHVAPVVEAVELVQQFQEGPLDLLFPAGCCVVPERGCCDENPWTRMLCRTWGEMMCRTNQDAST